MSAAAVTIDNRRQTRSGITVALAGNPNAGKTTLFNSLTGLKQKVANYPGVTVERKAGLEAARRTRPISSTCPGFTVLTRHRLTNRSARDVLTGHMPGSSGRTRSLRSSTRPILNAIFIL